MWCICRPSPCAGLVVFPNNVVHFEVGRTKSIAAIEAAMHANSSVFLVAQRRDG